MKETLENLLNSINEVLRTTTSSQEYIYYLGMKDGVIRALNFASANQSQGE